MEGLIPPITGRGQHLAPALPDAGRPVTQGDSASVAGKERDMTAECSALNRHVGERIKRLRVASGKSQAAIGAVLGLTFQQVQKYEKGRNPISIERLWRVAECFEVDIAYFFEDIDSLAEVEASVPPPSSGVDHSRLRLEIGRGLQRVRSAKTLRAVLTLIRSIADLNDPGAAGLS
jgi:DNA-binding XRE family transcriptional regulator